jgi:hypothetical protein
MSHDSATEELKILIGFRIKKDNCAQFFDIIVTLLFKEHAVHNVPPAPWGLAT